MVRSQGIRGAEGVIQMLGDCAGQGLVGNEIALSTPSISTAAKTRALLVPCAAIDYLECPPPGGVSGAFYLDETSSSPAFPSGPRDVMTGPSFKSLYR